MVRKQPYTKEEIKKAIDCLCDNDLIESDTEDDVYWFYRGLENYLDE